MEITKICPTCNKEMLRLNNKSFDCATKWNREEVEHRNEKIEAEVGELNLI